MKIDRIRLYHLSAPLPEPIGNAKLFFDRRDTLLVEVAAGPLSGWGETWAAPAAAAAVIRAQLAACVLGRDPRHLGRLWHDMRQAAGPANGLGMMAVAAIDMALHDLVAQDRGVPLSVLLGGARRDRIPAYASGPFFKPGGHPYRDFEREVGGYLRSGFRAIKLRSGFRPADDAVAALTVRRMIGAEAPLMIDFNQACTPRNAIATAALMEEAAPLWIEEPASPGDLAGYRLVSNHVRPAVAGGETYGTAAEFLPFLAAGAMDVLQPDIAICGGFTGVGQAAMLADLHDRPVVPHVWGGIVNFMAALHLAATLPERRAGAAEPFPYLEFDAGPNPLRDLFGRPALNRDGTVSVPDGPGLGIDPAREALEALLVEQAVVTA
ncbi:mandelate racemase/muconate lactonizing enzyme family protein [Inquilinus limosus]|uniref:mandelate racemase/muconate lactonizing enzyme family protein n=1 Tax=Inquilinus limosus TaxID=171674 RepID=UPI003F162929